MSIYFDARQKKWQIAGNSQADQDSFKAYRDYAASKGISADSGDEGLVNDPLYREWSTTGGKTGAGGAIPMPKPGVPAPGDGGAAGGGLGGGLGGYDVVKAGGASPAEQAMASMAGSMAAGQTAGMQSVERQRPDPNYFANMRKLSQGAAGSVKGVY